MALSEDTKAKVARLGKNQKGVLDALARSGQYPGSWTWGSHSTTVKICESLVKRGLATTREVRGVTPSRTYTVYAAIPEICEDFVEKERERNAARHAARVAATTEADRRRLEREAKEAATTALVNRHEDEYTALLAEYRTTYGLVQTV